MFVPLVTLAAVSAGKLVTLATEDACSGSDNASARSSALMQLVSKPPAEAFAAGKATECQGCCNDGHRTVPCFDVHSCAAKGPERGRYAMVFSYVGVPPDNFLPHIESAKAQSSEDVKIDLILIMHKQEAPLLTQGQREILNRYNVQLRTVDWDVPPNMKYHPSFDWCGGQDLIRLHALTFEGYDAVAYYDTDIEFQGDITPVFKCAATGTFITTNGGIGEPLNVGFFATKPDMRLMQAALAFARDSSYDRETGWSGAGWAPSGGYYVGAECGQGFFHTLFYKQNASVSRKALEDAGLGGGSLIAKQVNRCEWNYQTSSMCNDFDCSRVRAHHKPVRPGSNPKECLKRGMTWKPCSDPEECKLRGMAWKPPPKALIQVEAHEVQEQQQLLLEDSAHGLPVVSEGVRPSWLLKHDSLVVDGSPQEKGGILLVQLVLPDKYGDWVKKGDNRRPQWLRAVLSANLAHVRSNGHKMALRSQPSDPQLTPWQIERCNREGQNMELCQSGNERENYNWEKHLMMIEYLENPAQFSHVIIMDADAALVRPDHDTLKLMAAALDAEGKDILLTDEDWMINGKGRINGGVLFAKNTKFSQNFFRDTFEAHLRGEVPYEKRTWRISKGLQSICVSNEQICLSDVWQNGKLPEVAQHVILMSGRKYNRGACVLDDCGDAVPEHRQRMRELGLKDPDLEIIHFMGGSKSGAANFLCQSTGRDLTGQGLDGYGCKN